MENQPVDPHLWQKAEARVKFKRHVLTYVLVNSGLWVIWFISGARVYSENGIPWPVWPMLGWGIGLIANYIGVYEVNIAGTGNVEAEYRKLKERNG
jgi:hypothetical protein